MNKLWKCFIILKLKICISLDGKNSFKKKGWCPLNKFHLQVCDIMNANVALKKNVNYFWLELKVELNSSSFFFKKLWEPLLGFFLHHCMYKCFWETKQKKHFLTFDNFINDILRPNQQKLKWKKQQHHYKNLLHS